MAQIYPPSFNTISKVSIVILILLVVLIYWKGNLFIRSPYLTGVRVSLDQPIPFSHKHHVQGLGIDCRYCHTTVEEGDFAGIPSTHTCMTCHSQIWSEAPMLKPVRESYRTGLPLEWVRVHNLADFVYFNHSVHVAKGVECKTCHGPVEEMPLTWRENTLHMSWCLECHQHPERYQGVQNPSQLTNCSVCHR